MINEIRDSKASETLVQRLGVYELRGLAREMGIPSPTTKKRDELVALILESFKNGGEQDVKVQRRGRPYKKLTSLEEIISSVKESEAREEKIEYDSIIRFAQEDVPAFTTLGPTERIEGIVRRNENNIIVYALRTGAKAFVGDVYAREKLENGDLVEVNAQKINDEDYQVVSISLINGVSATIYQNMQAKEEEEVISNEEIETADHHIFEGRRNACLMKNDLYENNGLLSICDYCSLSNAKLVLIGANTSYENQIHFKNLGIKYNFTSVYGTDAAVNLNNTINGLNYAENAFQKGESVVVVVTDLGGLLLALDENFEKTDAEHAKETEVIAKKILSLASALKSGRHLTLVLFYNDIDSSDKFLNGDLLRVCKRS